MKGDLKINGFDAYEEWGAFLEDGALSALMTPAPLKEYIINENTSSHGKVVVTDPRGLPMVKDRDVTIVLCIRADSEEEFLNNYMGLVAELQKGLIEIKTKYQPDVVYRFLYLSCQQFAQYDRRLGKFSLRLNEPNPMNRDNDD